MRLFHIVLLTISLLTTGCAIGGDTEASIRDGIAINAGYAKRKDLPPEAKAIALDNHDLLWSILYREGVVGDVPADVRKRHEEREKLRKAAAKKGGGK